MNKDPIYDFQNKQQQQQRQQQQQQIKANKKPKKQISKRKNKIKVESDISNDSRLTLFAFLVFQFLSFCQHLCKTIQSIQIYTEVYWKTSYLVMPS